MRTFPAESAASHDTGTIRRAIGGASVVGRKRACCRETNHAIRFVEPMPTVCCIGRVQPKSYDKMTPPGFNTRNISFANACCTSRSRIDDKTVNCKTISECTLSVPISRVPTVTLNQRQVRQQALGLGDPLRQQLDAVQAIRTYAI